MSQKKKKNIIVSKSNKSKSASKKISKKALIVSIVLAVIILTGVGVGIYFMVPQGNEPKEALEDYCKAYNKHDVPGIEKCIVGSFDESEFQKASSYSVLSFDLKSENSKYAVAEVVLEYPVDGKPNKKDTFTIYFQKDGKKWKMCSAIDFDEKCNSFVKIQ